MIPPKAPPTGSGDNFINLSGDFLWYDMIAENNFHSQNANKDLTHMTIIFKLL